jgi:hypothetical protein
MHEAMQVEKAKGAKRSVVRMVVVRSVDVVEASYGILVHCCLARKVLSPECVSDG